jgi:hypothetical protein
VNLKPGRKESGLLNQQWRENNLLTNDIIRDKTDDEKNNHEDQEVEYLVGV